MEGARTARTHSLVLPPTECGLRGVRQSGMGIKVELEVWDAEEQALCTVTAYTYPHVGANAATLWEWIDQDSELLHRESGVLGEKFVDVIFLDVPER